MRYEDRSPGASSLLGLLENGPLHWKHGAEQFQLEPICGLHLGRPACVRPSIDALMYQRS